MEKQYEKKQWLNIVDIRPLSMYLFLCLFSDGPELLQCFLDAVHGTSSEEFLINLLQAEDHDEKHLDVLYYLKVGMIALFQWFMVRTINVFLWWIAHFVVMLIYEVSKLCTS